jgi:2-methylisocitrate lyase-like PEP mutase family enzyme
MTTVARFRELHDSGCFVLPNPWDVGSAVLLQHLGFHALATTSAGLAFSRGLPDRVDALACEESWLTSKRSSRRHRCR